MSITLFYAGLLAVWFFILSLRVIRYRGRGIALGDGGDAQMLRLIRGHGNFAEYAPLVLLLMALLESQGAGAVLLHVMGLTLLAGRLLHGVALSYTAKWRLGRVLGMILTFAALMTGAVTALWMGSAAL